MNRDGTIKLFERCEAARAEAKAKALADGKSEREARTIAHEAAKAIWNGWAAPLLAERKKLEEEERWSAEKDWRDILEGGNEETRKWLSNAAADFSRCHFQPPSSLRAERSNPAASTDAMDRHGAEAPRDDGTKDPRVKTILLEDSDANFSGFLFPGTAWFDSATFTGDAWFVSATFTGDASFVSATFTGDAWFVSATFTGDAWFVSATFTGTASFPGAKFDRLANFANSQFHGPANFNAIRGERAFSLADATFEHVPDFIQAHFEEAPRLDNVTVEGKRLEPPAADDPENPSSWFVRQHRALQRWSYRYRRVTMDDRDIPARWRALKRLAIQAHDQDREHEFFSREIRSDRFLNDWPLPFRRPDFSLPFLKWLNHVPFIFWELRGWFSFARFWAGKFYGLFSNYGRSVLLPALWWFAGVAVAAMFYLGEVDGMRYERQRARAEGAFSAHFTTSTEAWWGTGRSCYEPPAVPASPKPKIETGEVGVIALSEHLRRKTTASYEAFQLALRDGFLILYGDADTAHRVYGCLYGVELYGGGTPVAIVPPQVGFWSAMHKIWSAIMIFLFGLALRNMLKMK